MSGFPDPEPPWPTFVFCVAEGSIIYPMSMEVVMAKKNKPTQSLYQVKVTLMGSKPPIWRRLILKDNTRLDQLHTILQVAMGWSNSHLHQYRVGRASYIGVPDPEFDMDVQDESRVYLNDVLSMPKDHFVYEYDFGDDWEHKIVLEKILPVDASASPLVVKGKMACPPEDCGGIWGYYNLLEIIADPKHEEHDDMLEWIGGEIDPEAFDMEIINQRLGAL